MKILFASSSSGSRGGGEIHLRYLAQEVARRGHNVVLWASAHPRMDELSDAFAEFGQVVRADYTNTYDRPLRTLHPHGRTPARLAAEWSRLAPDFIHINKQNLEDGLDLLQAADLSGIPSLAVVHITQHARYLKAKGAAARDWRARQALLRYRGPLVAVQEARLDDLCGFLGDRADIYAINNGVPLLSVEDRANLRRATRAELGLSDDQTLVLAVARMIEPQKRPSLFLDAAEAVTAALPSAHFLWVGDGPYAETWDERLSTAPSERIRRIPWASTVLPYLAAADVFLHTAGYEGLPLAVIEAMSAGLPCVLPKDLAADLKTFPHDAIVPFGGAAQLTAILSNAGALEAAASAGRAFVEAELSLDRMADRYLDLYTVGINQATFVRSGETKRRVAQP